MEVIFFSKSVKEYITITLDRVASVKTFRTISLLEEFGHELGFPYSRKITGKLFELRVHGKQEVRIFYIFHKNSAVLLHVYIKKSQKTPQREIETAERRGSSLR